MDIAQVIVVMTLIVTNMGAVLYLHFRQEDKISAVLKEVKADTNSLISAIKEDVKSIQSDVKAIHEEMKDFHKRLCVIEEKKK